MSKKPKDYAHWKACQDLAAKLHNDGLRYSTFTKAKALKIAARTVSPNYNKALIELYPAYIRQQLKTLNKKP